MHQCQSIPAAPSQAKPNPPTPPPPGLLQASAGLVSPGGGAFANFAYAVSYQNITTQRILLEKQADWLICQRRGKIEEVCKGMFSILCMHAFLHCLSSQNYIKELQIGSYRRESTFFWL